MNRTLNNLRVVLSCLAIAGCAMPQGQPDDMLAALCRAQLDALGQIEPHRNQLSGSQARSYNHAFNVREIACGETLQTSELDAVRRVASSYGALNQIRADLGV